MQVLCSTALDQLPQCWEHLCVWVLEHVTQPHGERDLEVAAAGLKGCEESVWQRVKTAAVVAEKGAPWESVRDGGLGAACIIYIYMG